MRNSRTHPVGLALASLVLAATVAASPAGAQQAAPPRADFVNSWYWGVKGGTMHVKTLNEDRWAPLAGIEWLITRERVGLQLSLSQGFFNDVSTATAVRVDSATIQILNNAQLDDYRQASATLLAFPIVWRNSIRPYAGVGLAVNIVRDAEPGMIAPTPEEQVVILRELDDQRSIVSAVFKAGLQAEVKQAAFFAEATLLPTKREFLLNGSGGVFTFDAGVRFNFARAIEPLR